MLSEEITFRASQDEILHEIETTLKKVEFLYKVLLFVNKEIMV